MPETRTVYNIYNVYMAGTTDNPKKRFFRVVTYTNKQDALKFLNDYGEDGMECWKAVETLVQRGPKLCLNQALTKNLFTITKSILLWIRLSLSVKNIKFQCSPPSSLIIIRKTRRATAKGK